MKQNVEQVDLVLQENKTKTNNFVKMKKHTFFLDMDGVICDLLTGVINHFNKLLIHRENTVQEYVELYGKYHIHDFYGLSNDLLWKMIEREPNFWLNLPMFPWSKTLYADLRELGKVVIVTQPVNNPDCFSQKIQWLNDKLDVPTEDIVVSTQKNLMAGHGILIDDRPDNIDNFINSGGRAILIPSNWNTIDLSYDMVWEAITSYLYFL